MSIRHRPSDATQALDRAVHLLGKQHPHLAGRLGNTLDLVLEDFHRHPRQDSAWGFSQLNSNGTPVEFTFSSLSEEIRYAVEVAGPELPHTARLAAAGDLLRRLGAAPAHRQLVEHFGRVQAGMPGALQWGAWLGIRHLATHDEYKIYAEIAAPSAGAGAGAGAPAASPELAAIIAAYLGEFPRLGEDRALDLVAIGQVPGSPRMEFYFRARGLGLCGDELMRLLAPLGLANGHAAMWELLQSLPFRIGAEHGNAMPSIPFGFSCSVLPGKQQAVGALFAFADQLIGADAFVCIRLAQLWHTHGWPASSYLQLAAPLAKDYFSSTVHHNMIALLLSGEGQLGMHVTLSPPML